VTNGQVVATLDRAGAGQLVAQAEAALAVASASRTEAHSAAEIARREHDRVAVLHEQRIASISEYDASRATYLGSIVAEEVALARVRRAEAALESASPTHPSALNGRGATISASSPSDSPKRATRSPRPSPT